jgi:hypothetical protein
MEQLLSFSVYESNEIFLSHEVLYVTKRRVLCKAKKAARTILEKAKSGSLISNNELKFPTVT